MLKIFRIAAAIYIALGFTSALAASFDCSKASTHIEREICEDEDLSDLDEHLAKYFMTLMSSSTVGDAAQLRHSQRQWLTGVRNQCLDNECIKLAYRARLAELRNSGVPDEDYNPEDDCQALGMPSGSALCSGYLMLKKRELIENELQQIYEKVVSALPDNHELADERQLPQKTTFIAFFKSWEQFREDYCAIYGDLSGGAQMWKSVMAGDCKVNSAAAQIRLLQVLLKCIQGQESCLFPDHFGYGF